MQREGSARRVPAQERSRRLVRAVREAGALILAEEGPGALTTTRIAERAGVSVGSLYQYFENRDAVLHAIYEEKTARDAEATRRWIEHMRRLAPSERAVESIRWAFDQHRQRLEMDPDFYRDHHRSFTVSSGLGAGSDDESPPTALARSLLRDAAGEMRDIDADHAAVILGRGIPALLRGVLEERPELLKDDAFCESIVDLVNMWLFGAPVKDERD